MDEDIDPSELIVFKNLKDITIFSVFDHEAAVFDPAGYIQSHSFSALIDGRDPLLGALTNVENSEIPEIGVTNQEHYNPSNREIANDELFSDGILSLTSLFNKGLISGSKIYLIPAATGNRSLDVVSEFLELNGAQEVNYQIIHPCFKQILSTCYVNAQCRLVILFGMSSILLLLLLLSTKIQILKSVSVYRMILLFGVCAIIEMFFSWLFLRLFGFSETLNMYWEMTLLGYFIFSILWIILINLIAALRKKRTGDSIFNFLLGMQGSLLIYSGSLICAQTSVAFTNGIHSEQQFILFGIWPVIALTFILVFQMLHRIINPETDRSARSNGLVLEIMFYCLLILVVLTFRYSLTDLLALVLIIFSYIGTSKIIKLKGDCNQRTSIKRCDPQKLISGSKMFRMSAWYRHFQTG